MYINYFLLNLFSSRPEGTKDRCNSFDFLLGFLVYDMDVFTSSDNEAIFNEQGIKPFLRLASKYTPQQLNRYAYDATFQSSGKPPASAFSFCYDDVLNKSCRAIVFDLMGGVESIVSNNYLELVKGSCADTFSTPHW